MRPRVFHCGLTFCLSFRPPHVLLGYHLVQSCVLTRLRCPSRKPPPTKEHVLVHLRGVAPHAITFFFNSYTKASNKRPGKDRLGRPQEISGHAWGHATRRQGKYCSVDVGKQGAMSIHPIRTNVSVSPPSFKIRFGARDGQPIRDLYDSLVQRLNRQTVVFVSRLIVLAFVRCSFLR